jgi:hypothetical protein
VSSELELLANLIWATRGRLWGFRFLLRAGLSDPLPEYERAFQHLGDGPAVWACEGGRVALRLADPLNRRDGSGRVIPHEFVILGDPGNAIGSAEDGMREVWPLVADAYAHIWDATEPPSTVQVRHIR